MCNVVTGRTVPLVVEALIVSVCTPPDAILGRSASTAAAITREPLLAVSVGTHDESSDKAVDFEAMAYVTWLSQEG